MTATMYYDNDADPAALAGQTVAIIGYGSQGHAHALNLHESGVDVIVGLAPGSKSRALAADAGLRVADVADAVKAADVIMILVPDTSQKAVYDAEIEPHLRAGHLLMFAHGFNIHFGRIDPPGIVDVGMIAPKGPGHLLRSVYRAGGGVPALFAVHRDQSGTARDRVLAYGRAIGSTRAGVLETTFAEETETDLFGEQAVLCGGTAALVKMGFETLVEAGYQPELAYFETMHELKLIVDLMYRGGLNFMRFSVSDTAEYGDYVSGPRIIDDHVRDDHEAGPQGDPGRDVRPELDRRERVGAQGVRAPARRRSRPPHRARRVAVACPDAVPRPGRGRRRPVPGVGDDARRGPVSAPVPRPAGPFVAAGSVRIFDTTLRDGEQAPGRRPDRRREARRRAPAGAPQGRCHRGRLPGRLARRLRGGPPDRAGDPRRDRGRGARPLQGRRPATGDRGDQGRRAAAPPRLHRDQRHPPQAQAPHRPRDGAGRGGPLGPLRARAARPRRRDRVLRRGRLAHRPRLPAPGLRGGRRGRRLDGQHPRHRRLRHPVRVRSAGRARRGARRRPGDGQRPLPQRPGARDGQHAGRGPGRRPPGRGHDQRPRRACRQRLARRGRDGAAHAPDPVPGARLGRRDGAADRGQPPRELPDRLRHPAKQGDRRRQRLRP